MKRKRETEKEEDRERVRERERRKKGKRTDLRGRINRNSICFFGQQSKLIYTNHI